MRKNFCMKFYSPFIIGIVLFSALISCKPADKSLSEFIENGEFKTAADTLLKTPAKDCNEKDLLIVGQFFSERTAYQISIPLMEKLLEKDPENVPGRLLLANNLRNTKEDDNRVIRLYNDLADIDSIRFIILPERARLFIRLDEVEKAEQDIAEAKSLQPKYFASFLADGLLQYSQGKLEEALELLDIAENLDPGVSSESSLYAGYILLTNNLNYDAMNKFTRAIEVGKNINKGYAFINRGVCQINLTDTSFACDDWDSGYYYMPEQAKTYIDQYCKNY